ncbi:MAG: integrase [Agrobacterium fabrum]|uniref:Integrase n=1 Tax=Agrobacterium fabrum TaxID=1176649 RepID=A0A2W5FJ82_9HYPH|nr:MAG: integrase [Agrobacterium fabrum]
MSKTLTVKFIANAKPATSRREIPDAACPGLYLILNPTGAKSWAVRYRFAGKPKKLTLGPVITERAVSLPVGTAPQIGEAHTLSEARVRANSTVALLREGEDPAQAVRSGPRQDAGPRDDTANGALNQFILRHVEKKNRPSTQKATKRFIDMYVRPEIGGKKVRRVSKADFVGIVDKAHREGGPASANRVLAILKKFGAWCVAEDILPSSPAETIRDPAPNVSRDRVLTDDEIRWLWRASGEFGYPFGSLWRVLLLTAQRREEVAAAPKEEFSLKSEDPLWIIPRERTKNGKENALPLVPAVVAILEGLPVITECKFLFSTTGETSISGYSRAKGRLDARMMEIAREDIVARGGDPDSASIQPWVLHDLRRTAASGMAKLGAPIHVVEAILNHKSGAISGVAAIYNRHDYADEKRKWLLLWTEKVLSLGSNQATLTSDNKS